MYATPADPKLSVLAISDILSAVNSKDVNNCDSGHNTPWHDKVCVISCLSVCAKNVIAADVPIDCWHAYSYLCAGIMHLRDCRLPLVLVKIPCSSRIMRPDVRMTQISFQRQ